jgi:hypothetical protein
MWLVEMIIAPIMFVGGLLVVFTVIGMMMEMAAENSEDYERCLNHATNGYEIEKCK